MTTPYTRLLVPLDGSELGEQALQPALTLAQALSAQVLLLRVATPPPLTDVTILPDTLTFLNSQSAAYLAGVMQRQAQIAVPMEAITEAGSPVATIAQVAAERGVDAIIMSSHGRSGVGRWVYGSVTEGVMARAGRDVLIVRAQTETPLFSQRRFLVTLDGSPLAERALAPAVALAQAMGAELHLLRVTFSVSHLEPQMVRHIFDKMEIEERIGAERYLAEVRQKLSAAALPVHTQAIIGDTASTIVEYARQHHIDLICISSHGRSGVQRWLYGSVALKVLQGAPCATLIVRTP